MIQYLYMYMEKYLQFGKYTLGCPQWLLSKMPRPLTVIDRDYIIEILRIVKEEFNPSKYEITKTHDFKTSRFISVADVLEKRQYSCGSLATVVASVLRNLGIPVKLINGKFVKNNPNMKHAWVEVFILGDWVPFDIMQKKFVLTGYHVKKDEWLDWADLEKVYKPDAG